MGKTIFCTRIKDIAANNNAMRLKITFKSHKNVFEDSFLVEEERKIVLFAFYFIFNAKKRKVREQSGEKKMGSSKRELVFKMQLLHHFLETQPSKRFCAHASTEEFDKQPLRITQSGNQKPKDGTCFYRPHFCFIFFNKMIKYLLLRGGKGFFF